MDIISGNLIDWLFLDPNIHPKYIHFRSAKRFIMYFEVLFIKLDYNHHSYKKEKNQLDCNRAANSDTIVLLMGALPLGVLLYKYYF